MVADTPMQEDFSEGCPNHPRAACGSNDMFMNYMDYSNDACMNIYTQGQRIRMRAIFSPGGVWNTFITSPLDDAAKLVLQSENKGSREYQEYSFNTPPHRIRVFDIVGAERLCVENVPEGNRHELDISHLTPGVYVVHLEHRNGTVVRQLRVD